jgi:ABC-type lipoprotein release transport system permease subunit
MSGLLLDVNPADPRTLGLVGTLAIAVALAACLIPARRAARIDPLTTLRGE